MNGKRVIMLLATIVLVTAVVPPLAATAVNRRRIRIAEAETRRLALSLAASRADGAWLLSSGNWPRFSDTAATDWHARPFGESNPAAPSRPDPWGNRYIGLKSAGRAVVISAGPNGIIETPPGAPAASGDDVFVPVVMIAAR